MGVFREFVRAVVRLGFWSLKFVRAVVRLVFFGPGGGQIVGKITGFFGVKKGQKTRFSKVDFFPTISPHIFSLLFPHLFWGFLTGEAEGGDLWGKKGQKGLKRAKKG